MISGHPSSAPYVISGQPGCWPDVAIAATSLACRIASAPTSCEFAIAWRLPEPARIGPLEVVGVNTWERRTIWLRCDVTVPASSTLELVVRRPADLDGDGFVDATDLSVLLGDWGGPETRSDLNIDGRVDAGDQAVLLGAWGQLPTPAARADSSARWSGGPEVVMSGVPARPGPDPIGGS